jgi:hypothetical protein
VASYVLNHHLTPRKIVHCQALLLGNHHTHAKDKGTVISPSIVLYCIAGPHLPSHLSPQSRFQPHYAPAVITTQPPHPSPASSDTNLYYPHRNIMGNLCGKESSPDPFSQPGRTLSSAPPRSTNNTSSIPKKVGGPPRTLGATPNREAGQGNSAQEDARRKAAAAAEVRPSITCGVQDHQIIDGDGMR